MLGELTVYLPCLPLERVHQQIGAQRATERRSGVNFSMPIDSNVPEAG